MGWVEKSEVLYYLELTKTPILLTGKRAYENLGEGPFRIKESYLWKEHTYKTCPILAEKGLITWDE